MTSLQSILENHAAKRTKLTVKMFSADRGEPGEEEPTPVQEYVLIEGDNESIRFLGELLVAYASGDLGCSFDLHPHGAGSAHFAESSTVGLYIHKKLCEEE